MTNPGEKEVSTKSEPALNLIFSLQVPQAKSLTDDKGGMMDTAGDPKTEDMLAGGKRMR